MIFKVTRTSKMDSNDFEIHDFTTLDELIKFMAKHEHPLVISADDGELYLEIYDDYRE